MGDFILANFLLDILLSILVVILALILYAVFRAIWPEFQRSMGVKITFFHVRHLTKTELAKNINDEIMHQKRRKQIILERDEVMKKIEAETK